jgi:hypothetical protein
MTPDMNSYGMLYPKTVKERKTIIDLKNGLLRNFSGDL